MTEGWVSREGAGPGPPVGVFESDGPGATDRIATELSDRLSPGDLVLLEGEVGAGKSTFARAAMKALGVDGPIPSPTFTIGRSYRGRGKLPISHIDLYRLGPLSDEIPDLLGEYLDPDGITFVEWPGGGGEAIRSGSSREIRVVLDLLDRDDRDGRRITISVTRGG